MFDKDGFQVALVGLLGYLFLIMLSIRIYYFYKYYEEITPVYSYSKSNIKLSRDYIASRICVNIILMYVRQQCMQGIGKVSIWVWISRTLLQMETAVPTLLGTINKMVVTQAKQSLDNATVSYIHKSLDDINVAIAKILDYSDNIQSDVYLTPKSYGKWIEDALIDYVET